MTSEKRFSLSHSAFWNALLPMEEPYIRTRNSNLRRFAHELPSVVPPAQRGVVNECAFLLFTSGLGAGVHPEELSDEVIARCSADALSSVARMRRAFRFPPTQINKMEMREARTLAGRLAGYFTLAAQRVLRARPFFPGCGWVDDAEGDVLGDRTLFEIKAGERLFRGTDVRQLLCYCALNFSAKLYDIEAICLINPRSGTYFQDEVETLCQKTAGLSAPAVLAEIVNYMSEPFSRYGTG